MKRRNPNTEAFKPAMAIAGVSLILTAFLSIETGNVILMFILLLGGWICLTIGGQTK